MATYVLDSFTDSDLTGLDNHTPDTAPGGSAWAESRGVWVISSNQTALAAALSGSHANIDATVADCDITAEVNATGTNTALDRYTGIIARWTNTSNYWRIGINNGADLINIIEVNAGVSTSRASTAVTILAGTFYTVKATLSGQTITATVDGANQAEYASAALNESETVHGIMARETADRIDDFLIEDSAGGGAAPRKQHLALMGLG